jgi:hypothetical protein
MQLTIYLFNDLINYTGLNRLCQDFEKTPPVRLPGTFSKRKKSPNSHKTILYGLYSEHRFAIYFSKNIFHFNTVNKTKTRLSYPKLWLLHVADFVSIRNHNQRFSVITKGFSTNNYCITGIENLHINRICTLTAFAY